MIINVFSSQGQQNRNENKGTRVAKKEKNNSFVRFIFPTKYFSNNDTWTIRRYDLAIYAALWARCDEQANIGC